MRIKIKFALILQLSVLIRVFVFVESRLVDACGRCPDHKVVIGILECAYDHCVHDQKSEKREHKCDQRVDKVEHLGIVREFAPHPAVGRVGLDVKHRIVNPQRVRIENEAERD